MFHTVCQAFKTKLCFNVHADEVDAVHTVRSVFCLAVKVGCQARKLHWEYLHGWVTAADIFIIITFLLIPVI